MKFITSKRITVSLFDVISSFIFFISYRFYGAFHLIVIFCIGIGHFDFNFIIWVVVFFFGSVLVWNVFVLAQPSTLHAIVSLFLYWFLFWQHFFSFRFVSLTFVSSTAVAAADSTSSAEFFFFFVVSFFFIFALVPRGFAAHSFRTFFSADFGTLRSEKPLKFERNVGVGWLCYRWTCTMIEPHWNQKNVEKMDRNDWNMIYN